jgi:hypothetical protein
MSTFWQQLICRWLTVDKGMRFQVLTRHSTAVGHFGTTTFVSKYESHIDILVLVKPFVRFSQNRHAVSTLSRSVTGAYELHNTTDDGSILHSYRTCPFIQRRCLMGLIQKRWLLELNYFLTSWHNCTSLQYMTTWHRTFVLFIIFSSFGSSHKVLPVG